MRAGLWLLSLTGAVLAWAELGLAGQAVCPCVADNSVACHSSEVTQNVGGHDRLKIKHRENFLLLNFDLSAVPSEATISSATLRLKATDPKFIFRQVGVSTVSTAWVEGSGTADGEHDDCCFAWPGPRKATWAGPGSAVCDVIAGNGGTLSHYTFARPEADNWWAIDVDPRLVAALRADSFALAVQEETGWFRADRSNIFVYARESKESAPTLTVTWGQPDTEAPSPVTDLEIDADGLDDGQVLMTFAAGGDDGSRGRALGYHIHYLQAERVTKDNWDRATPAPRWQTPRPGAPGESVRAWITNLEPGKTYSFGVVAYDQSGNRSEITSTDPVALPGPTPPPRLRYLKDVATQAADAVRPTGAMAVWAVDELTKVDPINGEVLDGAGYVSSDLRSGSYAWDGKTGTVRLQALRGEIAGFNLVIEALTDAGLADIRVQSAALTGPDGAAIPVKQMMLHRLWYLKSKDRYYPEAAPPLDRPLNIPSTDNEVPGQRNQSVYVDLYVPYGIPAGTYRGKLQVACSADSDTVNVELDVIDLDMPSKLSFVIELNAYGFRGDIEQFHAMHRLAHLHRVGYNVLSYGHTESVSIGFLPKLEGDGFHTRIVDWSEWDRWMGPVLDGSAFEGLLRPPAPIPHFYLPFHENYPARINGHYARPDFFLDRPKGQDGKFDYEAWKDYMAEHDVDIARAFDRTWHDAAVVVARQWRDHLVAKGWTDTQFQIFCNDKHYFRNPEGRSSSYKKATSLWTLDEPSFGRDFRALGYIYSVFKPVLAGEPLNVACRGDVSRPQWQGDRLDGVNDLCVVSGAFYRYQTIIQQRRVLHGDRYWKYGGGRGPDSDNAALVALYYKNWTLGADGGLAYWTSFRGQEAWDKPDPLAVVHLRGGHGYDMPVGTTRLKAQRRAQQDIELMNMLAAETGWSRSRVARAVAAAINLTSETQARDADDPGQTSFADVHAADLARIRDAMVHEILAVRNR